MEWKIPGEMAETSVLLLSELVTNALRHAGCAPGREIWTRVLLDGPVEGGGRLRVEVSDACDALPLVRHPASDEETGRGLALVEALAHRWGAEPRACGIGKTVWFELAPVPGRPDDFAGAMPAGSQPAP
ncbi:ATP-binding protein [Streptomyces sp. NPDC047002]|uniref:ATP-binding protein n=1 Tax=Streptomyces sp. NPDC047002 TaxID=3155475 RepID=UPI0034511E60